MPVQPQHLLSTAPLIETGRRFVALSVHQSQLHRVEPIIGQLLAQGVSVDAQKACGPDLVAVDIGQRFLEQE